ncbi:G-type lectin S-receptor-like serine/threonine-protein kinase [Canna indica]|uniref:G-type lectin S-receptor-like serine/threonine-protein kinase n=1 Tax=Canna indica TaxID=4628 RepID=A0AAQ3K7K9_9LILI|nr:G-type lectin S-receptor-like serine/threonine-protein kinase [Canna indica]
MERLPLHITIFLWVFLSGLLLCATEDRITGDGFISSSETLVSEGGAYALGFFSPTNSSNVLYLGIWYGNIPQKTVVWVANREKPVTDSSAVLRIFEDSNLVVMDSKGDIYWSSNLSGFARSENNTSAVLRNTGNLVLRDDSNNILWQSFDHPTDTFLPGMKFHYTNSNHSTTRFTSWKDPNDPSPGNFSLGIDSNTTIQLLTWSGSKIYWRSTVWSGNLYSGIRGSNSNSLMYKTYYADENGVYMVFSVSDPSFYVRYTLNYSGQYQLSSWDYRSKSWQYYFSVPNSTCERYGWCGQFAYCDDTESETVICKCLEGFEPKAESEWNTGNFSAGCIRKKALQCGKGDGFLKVQGMKLPDQFLFIRHKKLSECRSECIDNCSCIAYAYADFTIGNNTISRCLVWTRELIDIKFLGSRGEDLYLRLMDINLDTSGGKGKERTIVMIESLFAAIFCLTCIFILWKFSDQIKGILKHQKKGKLLSDLSPSTDFQNNFSGYTEFVEGECDQVPELPLINFENILNATNNFSDSNKLGQGGFGIVYKGKLHGGQEIAIKRLIRGSGQGLEEFKNEVILIAKLQHRNLVRLLGCCIHGEERLLVYEYMANKSLDFFLFDPVQKTKLDWGKRFNIIKGIARALLYLHQDSRLRVIHRDLKASNILLDDDMNPKICDFGMARIFEGNQNEANTKRVAGTYGYMSPEYAMEGLFSVKSDVYSFGVLLLEIVSGFRNSNFHLIEYANLLAYLILVLKMVQAWKLWNEDNAKDFIDPSIRDSCSLDEVLRSIHIGLLCVQDSPNDRPAISSIVFMLENEATIPPTPKQPIFTIKRNLNLDRIDPPADTFEIYSSNNVTITTVEESTHGAFQCDIDVDDLEGEARTIAYPSGCFPTPTVELPKRALCALSSIAKRTQNYNCMRERARRKPNEPSRPDKS